MGLDKKTVLSHEVQRQTGLFVLSNRQSLIFRHASKVPGTFFRDEATLLVKEEIPLLNPGQLTTKTGDKDPATPRGTESTERKNGSLGFIYEMDLDDVNEANYHKKGVNGVKLDDEDDFKSMFSESTQEASPAKTPSKTKKKKVFPKSANSFYWNTTQDKLQQAVDYGITQFEALTCKVIGALGAYRLKVFERAYDFGIISNKYEEKEFLLRITQARIRQMQGLERLTNAYDHHSSEKDNLKRIQAALENYVNSLVELQKDIEGHPNELNNFDLEANEKLIRQIQDDIEAAKEFLDSISDPLLIDQTLQDYLKDTVLSASGPDSIAHFIKTRMIYALRQAQEHNQNMTYSRQAGSLFRGEFNSYCEDALQKINEYLCDHHNSVTPEHQGYFSPNPEHPLTLDFRHLGKNRQTVRRYIMAITQIEGADKIQKNNDDKYVLHCANSKTPHEKPLKVTRLTSWDIQAGKSYPFIRMGHWIWNLLVGIFIGFIDLPSGFISGLKGEEPTSNVSKYTKEFTPDCAKDTRFHDLAEKINFPAVSLGAKLGSLIGSVIRNTVWEVFKGVRTSVQRARFQIGENLVTDYNIFHNGLRSEDKIFQQVTDDINELIKQQNDLFQEVDKEHKTYYKNQAVFNSHHDETSNTKVDIEHEKHHNNHPNTHNNTSSNLINSEEIKGQFASAPYELSPGEWHDLINAALGGFNFLFDFVFNDIHAKHPFSGILYNAFYVLGTIAVLSPETLEFMGKNYIQISKSISDAATSNLTAGASFCASVEAQVAAMATEFAVSGRNSWLLTGLSSLEEEPSNMLAYCAIAVGLGAILAYGLNVPYISESIRAELGTVPAIALGVAGAKFGLCLFELFQTEAIEDKKDNDSQQEQKKEADNHEAQKKRIDAQREKIRVLLIEHFQEKHKLTDSKIDEIINYLLNPTLRKELERFYSTDSNPKLKRFQVFMMMQQNQHLLPHLPYSTKRELLELMHQNHQDFPGGESAMHQLLFPETKGSIIEITVSTILDYFPAVLACVATVVTWDTHPWRYLGNKLLKDLGRLLHAFSNKIVKTLAHYIRLNVRIVFDVLFNEIFARLEGLIRNNEHSLSSGHYSFSSEVDTTFETSKEFFAQPVDAMRKAVTQPSPQLFFSQNIHQFSDDIVRSFSSTKQDESDTSASHPKKPRESEKTLFEINLYPTVSFFKPSSSDRQPLKSAEEQTAKRALNFE